MSRYSSLDNNQKLVSTSRDLLSSYMDKDEHIFWSEKRNPFSLFAGGNLYGLVVGLIFIVFPFAGFWDKNKPSSILIFVFLFFFACAWIVILWHRNNQLYALSNKHAFIIKPSQDSGVISIALDCLGSIELRLTSYGRGSLIFGLNQQNPESPSPYILTNYVGFFDVPQAAKVDILLRSLLRRSSGKPTIDVTPTAPSADKESPAPRGASGYRD